MARIWQTVVFSASKRSNEIILGKNDLLTGVVVTNTDTTTRELSVEIWDRDVLQLQSKVIPSGVEGLEETALIYKKRCFAGADESGTVMFDKRKQFSGTQILSFYQSAAVAGTFYCEVVRSDT